MIILNKDSEDLLSVSVNLLLPKEIISLVHFLHCQPTDEFSELREYDPSAHFSVLNKFLYEDQVGALCDLTQKYFRNIPRFMITLDSIGTTHSKRYLFLYMNKESNKILQQINFDLKKSSEKIGYETWDKKMNKYAYVPHISLIKIDPESSEKALKIARSSFNKTEVNIDGIEITKEIKNKGQHVGFEKICRISLH